MVVTRRLPASSAWTGEAPLADEEALVRACRDVRNPLAVVQGDDDDAVGVARLSNSSSGTRSGGLIGILPALWPEHLGARSFGEAHGCRFPYVVGEMANGIATARMVVAAHAHGLHGFFGAAGLPPSKITV